MYPKSENGKNKKSGNQPNDRIKAEIDAESGYMSIGNEGMIDLLEGPPDGGAGGDQDNRSVISGAA